MTFPTLADVYAARARIADTIRPTPLMRHPLLSQETGIDLWVKHENHNPTSAFKVRGGLNLVRSLSPDERRRGVVTASTGNHGQSIALACEREGVALHRVRAGREQSRQERGDARVRRRRWMKAGAISTRRASAARSEPPTPARATCTRPTSRC